MLDGADIDKILQFITVLRNVQTRGKKNHYEMFLDGNIRMCKHIYSIATFFTLKSDYFDFVSSSNYILHDQYLLPKNAPKRCSYLVSKQNENLNKDCE